LKREKHDVRIAASQALPKRLRPPPLINGPLILKKNSWFENEEGGEGRCCVARSVGSIGVLVLPRFLPGYFLPRSLRGWSPRLRNFSSRRCRSVYNSALARGECGCGIHPTLLSPVTSTRLLYPSTRRRVSSATLRAVLRFLPELLLHSPLAEKGQ